MLIGERLGEYTLVFKRMDQITNKVVHVFQCGDRTTEWEGVPTEEELDKKLGL